MEKTELNSSGLDKSGARSLPGAVNPPLNPKSDMSPLQQAVEERKLQCKQDVPAVQEQVVAKIAPSSPSFLPYVGQVIKDNRLQNIQPEIQQ